MMLPISNTHIFAAALCVLAACPASAAAEHPRSNAQLRYTSERPGTPTGVEWRIDYVNPDDPNGKPPAVEQAVAHFPPGSVLDTSAPEQCTATDAELLALGTSACPPGSKVGVGALDVDTGSAAGFPRVLKSTVTNFNAESQSVLFTDATNPPTPLPFRTVTRSRVSGTTVTTDVAPFPGVPPPDPFVGVKSFRLSVDPIVRGDKAYVRTPPTCPASGVWTFTLEFTYRDGQRESLETQTPCRRPKKRQLRLEVSPRSTRTGASTCFTFRTVAGARVSFAGRSRTADRTGRARLCLTFAHPGARIAHAAKAGYQPARARVRVMAASDARGDTD